MYCANYSLNTSSRTNRRALPHERTDSSFIYRYFATEKHMSDTKRKTLKLRQKDVSGELPFNEKSVALHSPDLSKTLDHKNADRVGEQRRRINHPHDEDS